MNPSKTSSSVLASGRRQECHEVILLFTSFVAVAPWDIKRQCVHCGCWFEHQNDALLCLECIALNSMNPFQEP